MPLAHCSIGTTTDRINLLDETGIHVGDWEPVAGSVDTEFSTSPLADYRRLRYYRETTTTEKIDFSVKKSSQDDVIVAVQNLRRMCRAAMDYWVEGWNNEPVYLTAQASCETNQRYAIIHSGAVPEDNNPYGQPFLQQGNRALMTPQLILERGPWTDTPPGVATCIEACAPENYYCWPSYLSFGVSGDNVNCGNGVPIDDMPDNLDGMLVEAWVKADSYGLGSEGYIISKYNTGVGWRFYIDSTNGLCASIEQVTTDAISYSGLDEFTADGLWHHVAFRFIMNIVGDYIDLYIDGEEVSSYALRQAGTGAYVADAALDLIIGDRHGIPGDTWDGDIGWIHIRNQEQAPSHEGRCEIPDPDPYLNDSVGLWITEGAGATTYNRASPGTADGAITGADWECDCDLSYGRMCGDLEQCFPAYLNFNGIDEHVICPDNALIQDLPDDTKDMIAEAWVRADGWGENNAGHIIDKEDHPGYAIGWNFVIVNGTGLYGYVNGAGGAGFDGFAGSGIDEFAPDSLWHHVVMAVDSAPAGNVADVYLAIDGNWVTSYSTRQQKTGAYGSDVGENIIIGNRSDEAYTWDGDIAWVRLSDNLRYTPGVNFTPPPRCTLPTVDSHTMALWIYEGHGLQTWNLAGGEPGAIQHASQWRCNCTYDVDQSTSCIVQPYIANYLKTSGLTHSFYNDASGSDWSDNLQYANLPHLLLPPVPAVGDAIYFGVDSTLMNNGPFCNLVFDIMTAQSGLTGRWEYGDNWGGVPNWGQMTVAGMGPQDNTDADGLMTGDGFDTEGIKSVHWNQYATTALTVWQPVDLQTITADPAAPAITAYWVRWVVTGIATPTPPWQQNRHIYTISWPYVEIQEDDVPGDIAASLAMKLYNEADHDGGATEPSLRTSRLICGLRSLARGEDFVGYMNISDTGNPDFITFTDTGPFAFVSDTRAPTGTALSWVAVTPGAHVLGEMTISDGYTSQYYGIYRAYIRARTNAAAGDTSIRFYTGFGYSRGSITYTEWVSNQYSSVMELFDMGRLVIPPTSMVKLSEDAELGFVIEVRNNSGVNQDISLYDLILVPVDEWAGDFTATPDSFNGDYLSGNRSATPTLWGGFGSYAYIDSITYPKFSLRVLSLMSDTDNFTGLAEIVANRPAILQANKDQRLWFLAVQHNVSVEKIASIEIAHSVQIYRQANYLSMRGNR